MLRRSFLIFPKKFVRTIHRSAPAQSELVKKDSVGELLGKAHNNVEFVVSKVDDLVNWARYNYFLVLLFRGTIILKNIIIFFNSISPLPLQKRVPVAYDIRASVLCRRNDAFGCFSI